MGWVVLAVAVLVLLGVSNWITHITTADAKDASWRQSLASEQEWWRKYIERDRGNSDSQRRRAIEVLEQQHEDELIDLRRRCINYVVAMREADIAAGKEPFSGMAFDIALGSVPLRIERKDS